MWPSANVQPLLPLLHFIKLIISYCLKMAVKLDNLKVISALEKQILNHYHSWINMKSLSKTVLKYFSFFQVRIILRYKHTLILPQFVSFSSNILYTFNSNLEFFTRAPSDKISEAGRHKFLGSLLSLINSFYWQLNINEDGRLRMIMLKWPRGRCWVSVSCTESWNLEWGQK